MWIVKFYLFLVTECDTQLSIEELVAHFEQYIILRKR
jgi:hypothetical protein